MASTGILRGKVAVVTGASKGIGKAVSLALAREKANLVLVSRTLKDLEKVKAECESAGSGDCFVYPTDMSDSAAIDQMASTVLETHGGADILINNAGMMVSGTPLEGEPDEWEKLLKLNTLAPMRLTRRLAPRMVEKGEGAIVNIGSVAALEGMKGGGAYAVSKFGIRGWSLSTYEALRHKNIKVSLINPGFVNTPMVGGRPGLIYENMIQPEDVAEAVMLTLRTSSGCCPTEIHLRPTKSCYES